MLTEFGKVMIFLLLGVVFVLGGFVTNWLVRPKRPNAEKLSTYECGEEPVGSGWMKFNIRFYVVGLIFILFDVELVFLFPWAVVYKQMGMIAMLEMVAFLSILVVGFAYAWAKGDLEWVRPAPVAPKLSDLITYDKPRLKPMTAQPSMQQTQTIT